ncbi:MAG TPA: HAD-IIIC family phosphatase [Stellaceae bacterium]
MTGPGALYEDLLWLPRPPADFGARCKALASGEAGGAAFRALAGHALDINQLGRLAKAIGAATAAGADLRPLTPFRLGLLSNATTGFLAPALVATASRFNIALDIVEVPFGQAMQQAIDPDSELRRARPDAVLVMLDDRTLRLRAPLGDAAAEDAALAAALAQIDAIRGGVRQAGAVAIVQTVVPPAETLFGGIDRGVAGTTRRLVGRFNEALRDAAAASGGEMMLFDAAALAETVGLAAWHDPTQWALAKLSFALSLLPLFADHVCRIVGALRGQSRRGLVFDLDNTLWGGVIGDDGLEGIVVGQGDAAGESYLALQRYALDLRDRGIVLAVSSKNDDAVARQPFREHPDMLLREEHFTVFQANWSDKAANIAAIAEALSLRLDSLVFVDDNPAERALIRQKLPTVAVPELPADPALYARTLAAAGYFEAVAFSAEDGRRAAFYEGNARRLQLRSGAADLDDYLRSLRMVATMAPFDPVSRPRIAQLIGKSNQFNLTTRRYTEPEIRALEADPAVFTMQVRLTDTFGDNGMIGVVICRRHGAVWEIDTWLMSCRVLKRRIEEAVLQELVRQARAAGVQELRGRYIPSGRNGMVAGHYEALGFSPAETLADGTTLWRLPLAEHRERDLPIDIVATGFAAAAAAARVAETA